MSWLRRDDMRSVNRKIGLLTDREYRALDGLMEYVSRTKLDGNFDETALKLAVYLTPTGPKTLTKRMLDRYITLGLVDIIPPVENPENPHEYRVHDWNEYNPKDPTAAERMRNYRRNKDRNADRNETVTRAHAARPLKNLSQNQGLSYLDHPRDETADERPEISDLRHTIEQSLREAKP